ncbi:MAG TPA: alpha/beta hydrolase [Gemmataceae bacterium]|nr:alpha/beta hydrolase [Gemmataceae bacterium]
MPVMPIQIPSNWLRGILSLVPLGAGVYALSQALKQRSTIRAESLDAVALRSRRVPDGRIAAAKDHRVEQTAWLRRKQNIAFLLGVMALLRWSLRSARAAQGLLRGDPGSVAWSVHEVRRLRRPDGTELHIRCAGPPDGPSILFVHGLGADGNEWYPIRNQLAGRFRVIDWDLPGLGKSTMPSNSDWSLERLARDLRAVLSVCEGRPAILVGHSLGGMILLTFCRLFPETLGRQVRGLVLAHATYTNPMKTTTWPRFYTAIQKPIIEPFCHLTIWLAPLLRPLCVLSYLNGLAHRFLQPRLFTGRESWEVLDFLARYYVWDRPDVVGRVTLAMFHYDETKTLEAIHIPTLVVSGDQDPCCTPACQAFMWERIPGAQLLTLSPAKHAGMLEYPRQFARALEDFVSRCEQRSQPVPVGSRRRRLPSLQAW